MERTYARACALMTLMVALVVQAVPAQIPDRPIITEILNNPTGTDGPTGRNPGNLHQEFIEIFLPSTTELSSTLNKDALRLAFYEIEGDSGNSQRGLVNQRFDLPTFDLDAGNGITPGAIARPATGIVILGWVDYAGDPPTDLAGTPSTRTGLVNGGILTSPSGTLFVALNGAQFSGTTNFPVPSAESLVDVPNEHATGVFSNGSNVYLLVDRDNPGYSQLEDRLHPELGPADAALASGLILMTSALLDGIAGNDDSAFDQTAQPYATPTGFDIDLEDILPAGGAFSNLVAQLAEGSGGGYARRFVDELRTTEDGTPGNENPATDAQNHYRPVFRSGPFFPTPGAVVFATSPPELGVALSSRHDFEVIANTTGHAGLICANIGGSFAIDITAMPGLSSDPAVASFATAVGATGVPGQTEAFPQIAVSVVPTAADGTIVTAPVTFSAINSVGGNPAVVNPIQGSTAQVTVLNPTFATDSGGSPIETTVFAAIQGFGADRGIANEFLPSDLGAHAAANLGFSVRESVGNMSVLLDPAVDLEDIVVVDPLRLSFPLDELSFINAAGTTDDLVNTLKNSAKFAASSTYAASINGSETGVRAIEIALPETRTKGGTFSPSEFLFFIDSTGDISTSVRSGLSNATTARTFELALIDTNTTNTGIESGNADDFGLIVEVGRVSDGAVVQPGEFVFLSYTGSLEGEDIDSVDVPGIHATVAVLLDLDNLEDVLGCETITRLFLIDGSGNGTLNVMDVLSLNPTCGCPGDLSGNATRDGSDIRGFVDCLLAGGNGCDCADLDANASLDPNDVTMFIEALILGDVCP
ncbi:MAG: hypothetical protein MI923_05870 [Phycisphaerales bacterium]|nr:hypothetical protein [Phycisphaerales bacterium]